MSRPLQSVKKLFGTVKGMPRDINRSAPYASERKRRYLRRSNPKYRVP